MFALNAEFGFIPLPPILKMIPEQIIILKQDSLIGLIQEENSFFLMILSIVTYLLLIRQNRIHCKRIPFENGSLFYFLKIMSTIEQLEKSILHHKRLYYQGKPEISDYEYDQLEDRLKVLSPQNPILQAVGTSTLNGKKIKHRTKMLSLAKVYSIEELLTWAGKHELVSTHKIDGISCSLIYETGTLILAKLVVMGLTEKKLLKKLFG